MPLNCYFYRVRWLLFHRANHQKLAQFIIRAASGCLHGAALSSATLDTRSPSYEFSFSIFVLCTSLGRTTRRSCPLRTNYFRVKRPAFVLKRQAREIKERAEEHVPSPTKEEKCRIEIQVAFVCMVGSIISTEIRSFVYLQR